MIHDTHTRRILKTVVRDIVYDFEVMIDHQVWLYLLLVPRYLTLNNIVTIKSGLQVTQGH